MFCYNVFNLLSILSKILLLNVKFQLNPKTTHFRIFTLTFFFIFVWTSYSWNLSKNFRYTLYKTHLKSVRHMTACNFWRVTSPRLSLVVSWFLLLSKIYFRISDYHVLHSTFWPVHVYSRWSHVSSSSLHTSRCPRSRYSWLPLQLAEPLTCSHVTQQLWEKLNILWTFPCIQ